MSPYGGVHTNQRNILTYNLPTVGNYNEDSKIYGKGSYVWPFADHQIAIIMDTKTIFDPTFHKRIEPSNNEIDWETYENTICERFYKPTGSESEPNKIGVIELTIKQQSTNSYILLSNPSAPDWTYD